MSILYELCWLTLATLVIAQRSAPSILPVVVAIVVKARQLLACTAAVVVVVVVTQRQC